MKKVLVLLLCLLVLAGCTNNKVDEPQTLEEPPVQETTEPAVSFKITVCGIEVTEKEMASYELASYKVKLVNSKGTEKEYEYKGYRLTDVLKAIDINVTEGQVVATATDGYETTYKDNIILEDTLIAVLRDGEEFEEGPWLAPCSSTTNGDYLKNLSEIKIAVN